MLQLSVSSKIFSLSWLVPGQYSVTVYIVAVNTGLLIARIVLPYVLTLIAAINAPFVSVKVKAEEEESARGREGVRDSRCGGSQNGRCRGNHGDSRDGIENGKCGGMQDGRCWAMDEGKGDEIRDSGFEGICGRRCEGLQEEEGFDSEENGREGEGREPEEESKEGAGEVSDEQGADKVGDEDEADGRRDEEGEGCHRQ